MTRTVDLERHRSRDMKAGGRSLEKHVVVQFLNIVFFGGAESLRESAQHHNTLRFGEKTSGSPEHSLEGRFVGEETVILVQGA